MKHSSRVQQALEHQAHHAPLAVAIPAAISIPQPLTRRTLTYTSLYAWYILLATLDLITTVVILNLGGREVNPLADSILQVAGPSGMLVFKYASVMLVICICEFIAERRHATGRFVAASAVAITALPVIAGWAQLAAH